MIKNMPWRYKILALLFLCLAGSSLLAGWEKLADAEGRRLAPYEASAVLTGTSSENLGLLKYISNMEEVDCVLSGSGDETAQRGTGRSGSSTVETISDNKVTIRFINKAAMKACMQELVRLNIIIIPCEDDEELIRTNKEIGRLHLLVSGTCLFTSVFLVFITSRRRCSRIERGRHIPCSIFRKKIHGPSHGDIREKQRADSSSFSNTFGTFLRYALCSPAAYAVILVIPVLQFISGFDQILVAIREGTEFPFGYSLEYPLNALNGDLMSFMIPLLSSLPYAAGFVDDLKSGSVKHILLRTTRRDYLLGKMAACMTAGGLVIVAGSMFSAVLSVLILSWTEAAPMTDLTPSVQAAAVGVIRGRLSLLSAKMWLCFLSGMIWAGTGMLMSGLTGSRYVAFLSPFIVYYLFVILCERYFPNIWICNPREWLSPGEQWAMGSKGAAVWMVMLITIIILLFLARGEKALRNL